MSGLGLVKVEGPLAPPSPAQLLVTDVHFQDTLACGDRIWVRGQIHSHFPESDESSKSKSRWWRKPGVSPSSVPQTIHLVTEIAGSVHEATVPLDPHGRFEARLSMPLAADQRGWRIARHRVTVAGQKLEASNVVLLPAADSSAAIVVVLPLEFTAALGHSGAAARYASVARLTELIRGMQPPSGAPYPIYYVAGLADSGNASLASLGLAAAVRAWPSGNFIGLPMGLGDGQHAFAETLERLRWLFAGNLDLVVLNLEPAATALPVELREPAEEWAVVRRFLNVATGSKSPVPEPTGDRHRTGSPRPTRAALVPRYPVVFCHGMLAFSMLKMRMPEDLNCFTPLREFLAARGVRVLFPEVAPTAGVTERAESLRDQIRQWTSEPVNVIAHSMGGLDARFMIARLDMADQVKSLTTVSTPHRGTYLADWFLANYRQRVPLLLALEAFGVNVNGFRDCRLDACRKFNEETPDSPNVRYFSFGGEVSPGRLSPVLRRAWSILTSAEGPNDGMVSVSSARWGDYVETINADHFAQTPDAIFLRAGEDFDTLRFYCRMVENLARRGF
jgi:triacylglycerol esterase/lipase EstA (alpha/beta hydrolase family)